MKHISLNFFNLFIFSLLAFSCIAKGGDDVSATTLDVPGNVVMTANDGSSASFSWSEVKGAESYAARLELSGGKLLRQLNVDVPHVTLDGLTKGVEYALKLKACKGKVSSEYCEPFVFIAGETAPQPEPDPEPEPEPEPEKPVKKNIIHDAMKMLTINLLRFLVQKVAECTLLAEGAAKSST